MPSAQVNSLYYVYDQAGRVMEDSMAGGKVRDYLYANSQHLAVFWRTASDSGKVFYHCDHLGTPVAFTNMQAQRIAWESYYPFWELTCPHSSYHPECYKSYGKLNGRCAFPG